MNYRWSDALQREVSEIGFGTWPLSGDINGTQAYGKTDDGMSKEALEESFCQGVNLYDVSNLYGFGHVESLVGEVFEGPWRDNIVIITKGGMLNMNEEQNFSPNYLREELEKSLQRLKTDYVDIYMLHSPKLEVLKNDDLFLMLAELKKSGKVLAYGVSLRSPADGKQVITDYPVGVIEVNYNILDQRIEQNGLLDLCKEKKVTMIIRTPLAQGILTGKFRFNDDPSDRRNKWNPEKVKNLIEAYKEMAECIKPKDAPRPWQMTDSVKALRFCLSHAGVTSVIPGMINAKEVGENLTASLSGPLADNELKAIRAIYKRRNL